MIEWNTFLSVLLGGLLATVLPWGITKYEARVKKILHAQKVCLILSAQAREIVRLKKHFITMKLGENGPPLKLIENNWRLEPSDILKLNFKPSKENGIIISDLMIFEANFAQLLDSIYDHRESCHANHSKTAITDNHLKHIFEILNLIDPYKLHGALNDFLYDTFKPGKFFRKKPYFIKLIPLKGDEKEIYEYKITKDV